MTGCPSMNASDGISPTPSGSSASTSAALVVRQTGGWLGSASSTQVWLPVHPAGVWPGRQFVAGAAQRSLEVVAGSTMHTCVEVQALLQGGAGRPAGSPSPPPALFAPTITQ